MHLWPLCPFLKPIEPGENAFLIPPQKKGQNQYPVISPALAETYEHNQRNKIKILLRSKHIYVIIQL